MEALCTLCWLSAQYQTADKYEQVTSETYDRYGTHVKGLISLHHILFTIAMLPTITMFFFFTFSVFRIIGSAFRGEIYALNLA